MEETLKQLEQAPAEAVPMVHEYGPAWPLLALPVLVLAIILLWRSPMFRGVCSALASTSGVLLVVLFFLPWLGLNCQGKEFMTATGQQLAVGEITQKAGGMAEDTDGEESPTGKPWVWATLLFAGLAVAMGLAGLMGATSPSVGSTLRVVGAMGCCLMLYVVFIQDLDGWAVQAPMPDLGAMTSGQDGAARSEEFGREFAQGFAEAMANSVDEPDDSEQEIGDEFAREFAGSMEEAMEQAMAEMAEEMSDKMSGEMSDEMRMTVHTKWPVYASLTLYGFLSICGVALSLRKKK
jgi:hypothetical protein